jgi:antitoxin HicB
MRNLEHYLSSRYSIDIVPIPEKLGGGYRAVIPELGEYAFIGDGETPEEALESLKSIKEALFKEYLEKGVEIPEPKEQYSGKFLVRVPKELHERLVNQSRKNGSSLNLYVNYILTSAVSAEPILETIDKKLDTVTCKFDDMIETQTILYDSFHIIGPARRGKVTADRYPKAA